MFKTRMNLSAVVLAVVLSFLTAAVVQAAEGFEVGKTMLVKWSKDDYWYPATIVVKDTDRYFVRFHDGDEEWTKPSLMREEDIKVGDRVFGNYKNSGKYYPGKVTRRSGPAIHIKYDDGDEEDTTISFVRVKR